MRNSKSLLERVVFGVLAVVLLVVEARTSLTVPEYFVSVGKHYLVCCYLVGDCRLPDDIGSSSLPFLDFVLLYLAVHKITANSSFSWWAAHLKQIHSGRKVVGTVVAPQPW